MRTAFFGWLVVGGQGGRGGGERWVCSEQFCGN